MTSNQSEDRAKLRPLGAVPVPDSTGLAYELRGIGIAFPSKSGPVTVLDDVNFAVEQGQIVGIVGKSGTGKTSLLRILAGL